VLPSGSFADDASDFNSLHVDWDVPPFGNVQPPLPADTNDAEDLMEIPND
jgi:hypothetical protein